MIFMEMAREYIKRFVRLKQTGHDMRRIHPIIEYHDASVGLYRKTTMEYICYLHV